MIFNFIISKYMLTNVYEVDAIYLLIGPILSPLAKTDYLAIARIVF